MRTLLISLFAAGLVTQCAFSQAQVQQVNCPNPYTANQIILVQSIHSNAFSNVPAVVLGCYQLDTVFTIDNSTTPPTIGISPGVISGGTEVNFADEEVPSGSINGTNLTFTISHTPTSGSLKLFKNGLRLKRGVDYTLSVATITMLYTVDSGTTLVCDYRY